MKKGVRYIAVASGPKEDRRRTLLVGIIFRDNYIEGMLSTSIGVDGTDSTRRIIEMMERSRFKEQIRMVLLNGIALAGLNIINPELLEKRVGVKVLLLNRRIQNPKELIGALRKFSAVTKKDAKDRIRIVKEYGLIKPLRVDGMFIQSGLDAAYVKGFADRAFEALRVAHIIARGISTGESKGRL